MQFLRIGFFFLAVFLVAQISFAAVTFRQTVDDPELTSTAAFGSAVAIDESYVLVGAMEDTTKGNRIGRAYLFEYNSGGLLHTFDDPTPTDIDQFGVSVAISGRNILIGAWGDDTNGRRVGQAHLYDRITGNLLRTFNDPTPTAADNFGGAVAIDGNKVLIGASGDDTNGSIGQAHLFDAASGDLLHTFNNPNTRSFGNFGNAVAIDGDNVLIGSSLDSTLGTAAGQAHLFDAISGDLQFTFNDPTPTFIGGAGGVFAASVDIGDDLIVIGAPADSTNAIEAGQAHLFDTAGNLLHTFDDPQSNLRDNFGSSVAIDGTNVLIGARFDDADGFNVGQAHLFDAITGNLQNTLNEPSVSGGDRFGTSLAIDSDKIVIGSPSFSSTNASVSQVHLFELLIPEPSSVVLMLLASVCLMRRMK
ncbi:MAG: hypothetical protein RH917_18540 [Lacipirellulaceae bacterium]